MKILAKLVVNYFHVYRLHLQNHGLEDDSNSISVKELIDFVENHIDESEREWLGAYMPIQPSKKNI